MVNESESLRRLFNERLVKEEVKNGEKREEEEEKRKRRRVRRCKREVE